MHCSTLTAPLFPQPLWKPVTAAMGSLMWWQMVKSRVRVIDWNHSAGTEILRDESWVEAALRSNCPPAHLLVSFLAALCWVLQSTDELYNTLLSVSIIKAHRLSRWCPAQQQAAQIQETRTTGVVTLVNCRLLATGVSWNSSFYVTLCPLTWRGSSGNCGLCGSGENMQMWGDGVYDPELLGSDIEQ